MKIEAVKMNEILSDDNDIYQTVMVVSNRARQVIDKRFLEQINLDEIEDTDELIQFSKEDFDKEKPIMKAYKEFIDSELEWRSSNDDVDNLDDK
jgi:DNA-directed RNA polymerase subunit K/omega|tara:strand:+ start:506 stop:787 length:282 start_codon:yes stop_codon:yes gene_type:complete